jgi:hypothetical protein
MAEEQPIETAAAPAENGSGENGGGKKQFKREDLIPIEDLYDLSKPIPKVRSSLTYLYRTLVGGGLCVTVHVRST